MQGVADRHAKEDFEAEIAVVDIELQVDLFGFEIGQLDGCLIDVELFGETVLEHFGGAVELGLLVVDVGVDLVHLAFGDEQLVVDLIDIDPKHLFGDLFFFPVEIERRRRACRPTNTWPSNRTCLRVMLALLL